MGHAQLSPSAWERWSACPGSVALCRDLPDASGTHADEGTAAHEMAELILRGQHHKLHDSEGKFTKAQNGVAFTAEMLEYVGRYTNTVVEIAANNAGELHVEQRLPIWHWTGEPGAHGTSDAVILLADELVVADLKYGRGVEVDADCDQTKLYLLGTVRQVDGLVADITHCRAVILQPRLSRSPAEWDCTVDELRKWASTVAWDAVEARQTAAKEWKPELQALWVETSLNPNEKSCKFCKAKATCPALRNEVAMEVSLSQPATPDEFAELELATPVEKAEILDGDPAAFLAAALSKVDLIEDWCKGVRAEAERRLLAGESVPGYKVVQGKRGNRQWTDAKEAEQMLKTFRVKLEDMYEMKVISPTTAEKLAKAETIGKRQWPKLQVLITQSDGKPHVAPVSDPRPALDIKPVAEDFENVADDLA